MRYYVKQGEREWGVDIERLPKGQLAATLDGVLTEVTILSEAPTLVVAVGGRVMELFSAGPDAVAMRGGADAFHFESAQARALSRSEQAREGAAAREVRAPMPGRVVKVLVSPGDSVEPGAGLLVIEAMKMENELDARSAGVIAGIFVKPGDIVERGALLVSLE
jgi:biotin carboxyl carrier protein